MEEVLKKTRRTSQRQDCDLGHEGVELTYEIQENYTE
jgi:hypothetical protein